MNEIYGLLSLLLKVSHSPAEAAPEGAVVALFALPVSVIPTAIGFFKWKKYRKVADIPTSTVRGMAAGLVELNGKVKSIKLLTSPLTKTKCVYYKKQHQVYHQGKHSGWRNAGVEENFENFYLDNNTGKVEVNPELANITLQVNETRTRGDQRDLEYILSPGHTVYVLGTATIRPGVKNVEKANDFIITKGQNDPFFYISDKKEAQVKAAVKSDAMIYLIAGGAMFAMGLLFAAYLALT